MRRRSVLASVVTGVSTLGGCVGAGHLPSRSVERSPPTLPDDLTRESVIEHVERYEVVRGHNRWVEDGAVEVDFTATAQVDYVIDGGYHATGRHSGSVRMADEDGGDARTIRSDPVPYRVTETETVRLDVDRRRIAGDERNGTEGRDGSDGLNGTDGRDGSDGFDGSNGATEVDEAGEADDSSDRPLGVRIPNFTDRTYELAVSVVSDGGDGDVVSEWEGSVEDGSTVELRGLASTPDRYRLVANLSRNGVTGQGRVDVDLPGVDRGPNADVLLGPDGLTTRTLPDFDA